MFIYIKYTIYKVPLGLLQFRFSLLLTQLISHYVNIFLLAGSFRLLGDSKKSQLSWLQELNQRKRLEFPVNQWCFFNCMCFDLYRAKLNDNFVKRH